MWAHLARLDGTKLTLQASRFLPGFYPSFSRRPFHFLKPTGDRVQFPVVPTSGSVLPTVLRFDAFDGPPIEGDPEQLLTEWQKRLALRITEQGEIVHSISSGHSEP